METGDSLFGNGNLFLIDPTYNVRSKAGKTHSEHDVFSWDDIKDLVDFGGRLWLLCSWAHILCLGSLWWISGWYQILLGPNEEVPSDEPVESEESGVQN